MADSDALRSRRKRLHAAGDHHLCRHDARSAPVTAHPAADTPVDPHTALEALARRLEGAHETDPADAAVARELRATLLVLLSGEGRPDAELAALLDAVQA